MMEPGSKRVAPPGGAPHPVPQAGRGAPPGPDGPPWEMALCRRSGAPPVRFAGRRLSHHETASVGGEIAFIDLWQRRKGGFSIHFRHPSADGWQEGLVTEGDIRGAIDALESRCARPDGDCCDEPCAVDPGADMTLICTSLLHRARFHEDERRFRHLAGAALDRWTTIDEARRPAHR